jgi:undecaprenyl-diphosphatase
LRVENAREDAPRRIIGAASEKFSPGLARMGGPDGVVKMQVHRRILDLIGKLRLDGYILVLFLAAAGALFAFLKLASEMMEGDTLAFDRMLLQALRSPGNPAIPIGPEWLRIAMVDITALGGVTVLTLLTIVAAGYLVAARRTATAAFLVAAISGGALTSTLLKLAFARARPDVVEHIVAVHSASFPSGHALNSAVTYLTLGALLARTEEKRSVRLYLIGIAIFLTLIIGSSRVYLGVHWPSDVIAGWCVGAAWAVLCSLVARTLQRRRAIEPEQESVAR